MTLGLSVILLAVLVFPFLSKKVEENIELFLFMMGLAAVLISKQFSWHLGAEALYEPLPITGAVLVFGLIFKWSRSYLDRLVQTMLKVFSLPVFIFLLILFLGLQASIVTAIIAAIVLVEVVSMLKLDKKFETNLVIIACFAIGLGAALTPLGEPLSTIAIAKLKSWPHVNFWYLAKLLGAYIVPGILFLALLGVLFQRRSSEETLTAPREEREETLKTIILRAGKVYLFVMALVFLGQGFKPIIDEYVIQLSDDLLYWINITSAILDNATLTAAEISPTMTELQVKKILMGLLIAGGMLIPGNIPNIIAAGKLKISMKEWAKLGVPLGLVLMVAYFFILKIT
ncbi:MAG: DUF1646 family protein [Deltaproteobacteria bacterium]|nr:DUF1646 family protein [Deltaproteobacteria bacterium]